MSELTWNSIRENVANSDLDKSLSLVVTEMRQSVTAISVWTRTAELSCKECENSEEAFRHIYENLNFLTENIMNDLILSVMMIRLKVGSD